MTRERPIHEEEAEDTRTIGRVGVGFRGVSGLPEDSSSDPPMSSSRASASGFPYVPNPPSPTARPAFDPPAVPIPEQDDVDALFGPGSDLPEPERENNRDGHSPASDPSPPETESVPVKPSPSS